MGKERKLTYFERLTPDERAELNRKAQLARLDPEKKALAEQKRKRKRMLKEVALSLLQATPDDDDLDLVSSLYGIPREEVDNQMLACIALLREALDGNTRAFELLVQASGQSNGAHIGVGGNAPALNVQIVNASPTPPTQIVQASE